MTLRRTIKRIAVLRELASMGIWQAKAAELTGVTPEAISMMCSRHGIVMPPSPYQGPKPWLQRLIRRDYGKPGMNCYVMAARYGTSHESVLVTICRMRKAGLLPPAKGAKVQPEQEATP